MTAHRHNGSDVILTPTEESIEVHAGDSAPVHKNEEVSLTNPGSQTVEIIVAAGPAHFVAGIRRWPEPTAD